jgi:hypothetical protein
MAVELEVEAPCFPAGEPATKLEATTREVATRVENRIVLTGRLLVCFFVLLFCSFSEELPR